ncbi:MAG: hypothetical protein QMD99_14795 [Rhizobiaceae bacterium]|nr:hypothetical protein [Rhizobiaceae bacterium]
MANYWVAVRIENDKTYSNRYGGFLDALKAAKKKGYWSELTSFWFVESDMTIDTFTSYLSIPLSEEKDLLLVRKIASDDSRYFGEFAHEAVLLSFMPNAKKVG